MTWTAEVSSSFNFKVLTSKAQEKSQDNVLLEVKVFLQKFSRHLQNRADPLEH